mgnify:CR=1 FL=1
MDATIFMVTHDSYAASFCDRVIVLKDGKVHGELKRTGTRRAFMDELLNTIRNWEGIRMTMKATGIVDDLHRDGHYRLFDGFDPAMPRPQKLEIRRRACWPISSLPV